MGSDMTNAYDEAYSRSLEDPEGFWADAASGIDWKVGDEVLVYQDDFPANVYPWLALEKRGVTVSRLKTSAL